MAVVFEKPKALTDAVFHYCPGCTHGIIHRLVAEAIDTLGIEGRTIGIAPVGCSVLAYHRDDLSLLFREAREKAWVNRQHDKQRKLPE